MACSTCKPFLRLGMDVALTDMQATNFLNAMAFDIDLDAPGNMVANGSRKGEPAEDTRFKPVHRKWAP